MMKRTALLALLVALLLNLSAVGADAASRQPAELRVLPVAELEAAGSIVVRVWVRCDPVGDLLEAMGFANQDDAFAEGFFSGLTCDGRPRIERLVFTPFDDASFDPGQAAVSVFMLILVDETTGETVQASDFRNVRVRR